LLNVFRARAGASHTVGLRTESISLPLEALVTAKPMNAMLKVNLILDDDDWISSMSMKMKEVFDSDFYDAL
jgi:hypothetical protein